MKRTEVIIATGVKNSKADCDCSTITLMENTQPGQVITPGATIEPVAPPPPQAVKAKAKASGLRA